MLFLSKCPGGPGQSSWAVSYGGQEKSRDEGILCQGLKEFSRKPLRDVYSFFEVAR